MPALTTISLHTYQWEAVSDLSAYVSDGDRKIALVMPQGSGKSVAVACLLQKMRGMYRASVVVTPLLTVESGFLDISGVVTAELPEDEGSASSVRYDFKDFWFGVGSERRADRDAFSTHIRASRPGHFALVTTHHALRIWRDTLPESLQGVVLVVDEAHHTDITAEETVLGEIANEWHVRGGCVIYLTATPFRDNGVSIFSSDTKVHRRSIAQHSVWLGMDFKVERVGVEVEAGDFQEVAGKKMPPAAKQLAAELVGRWVQDGTPKSVFIVPPDASQEWTGYLQSCIEKAMPRARVHNAVGIGKGQQRALDVLLRAERKVKRFSASRIDVIISCRRFDEGTDWPLCSHVYNIGLPASYCLVLQRWGRAFRDKRKIIGYPKAFVNRATITFITPRASVETMQDFERKSHNMAMLLACFMEDHEVARQFVSVGDADRPRKVSEVRQEQEWIVDEVHRVIAASMLLTFNASFKQRHGRAPLVREYAKFIRGVAELDIRRALMILCAERITAQHIPRARLPQPDVTSFFEAMVEEYRNLTLTVCDGALRTYTTITGETSRQVVSRVGIRTEEYVETQFANDKPVEIRHNVFAWKGKLYIKRGDRLMEVTRAVA